MGVGITLGEIMKKAVITVKPNDSIKKVADTMGKTGIGGVIVTENSDIKGILTEGDIIREVMAEGKDEEKIKVSKIMKTPVETADRRTDLEEAIKKMRDLNIERLPIVENGELIGIVTERDLTKVEPALIEMAREKEAMTPPEEIEEEVEVTGKCEECESISNELIKLNGKLLCSNCRDLEL